MSDGTNPALPGMPGKISGYRIDGYIGRGPRSDVYRAHGEREGLVVAVKILVPGLAEDEAFRARFLRDSEATGEVGHPSILPVYEVGDVGGLLYVAMHYAQGGDVQSLPGRGPLRFARAWNIIAQVASALDAAHGHGLIHRDVKPSNILLDADAAAGPGQPGTAAGGDHVYLSDFGMGSPSIQSPASPLTGQHAGAPDFGYVAPEQIAGHEVDGRADLYSLACTGYLLLCGAPPFAQEQGTAAMRAHLHARPPTATALRPDLPAAVDLVLAKALAKNPADRYPTCAEFAQALQTALGLAGDPAGSPMLPSQGLAGMPVGIWPGYSEAGGAAAAGLPGPAQPFAPVLVGPDGPQPPLGAPGPPQPGEARASAPGGPNPGQGNAPAGPPSGPGRRPGGRGNASTSPMPAVPGPDDTFRGPAGPGGRLPAPDDPFGDAGLYREPTRRYPGQDDSFPDEALGLYRPPGRPYQAPGGQYPVPGALPPRPTARYPARPRRRRSRTPGIVGAFLVVLVVAVVVGVVLTRKSAPPHASPPPQRSTASAQASTPANASAEAAAVNNLLAASASARSSLPGAVTNVRKCTDLPTAVGQLQDVVNQRNLENKQASALSTAALPNGAAVKSDLVAALHSSLTADRDYLTFARQESSGCTPGATTSAYNAAIGADSQAATAKQAFVAVWNPIATAHNLPQQSSNSF